MKRVTGIGGIFFKAKDAQALREWYQRHLGIELEPWGGSAFRWTDAQGQPFNGTTVWNVFEAGSDYFAPSKSPFMINYRVDDLEGLLAHLRAHGVAILQGPDVDDNGSFAWIQDPDGNKVELWEPKAMPAKDGEA